MKGSRPVIRTTADLDNRETVNNEQARTTPTGSSPGMCTRRTLSGRYRNLHNALALIPMRKGLTKAMASARW